MMSGRKDPKRNLIALIITGVVVALLVLAFCVKTYLVGLDLPSGATSVPVDAVRVLLDMTRVICFVLLPALALGYLLFAVVIWQYLRRVRNIGQEKHKDV